MGNFTTKKSPIPFNLSENYWLEKLELIFKSVVKDLRIVPLPGDASTRRYFRLTFRKKFQEQAKLSAILMWMEEPELEKEPDFSIIAKYLRDLDLPTPKIFHHDVEKGFLFLEDFGDILLSDLIDQDQSLDKKRTWYRKAVILLAELQSRATKHISPECPAFHLKFDIEKLMWEFNFMLTHYVEGLKKHSLSSQGLGDIHRSFKPICETLAAQKFYFTHRDYHSRNLMVQDGQLKILDFQDARMGPCQYDLVSLLKDSYVPLEENLIREMVDLFIQLKENKEGKRTNRQDFYNIFDLMAIQRNLKALGTFAFQKMHYNNESYLPYIPNTLSYVRQTLERHPELLSLRDTLAKYIPEVIAPS